MLLTLDGNRIEGTCGLLMGPGFAGEIANATTRIFDGQTSTTPLVYTVQVPSGANLERLTTFTISWTAAGGPCEWFVQGSSE